MSDDGAALAAELRATFLFEPFTDEQMVWLMANAAVMSYPGGHRLFEEGRQADALYVLLTGSWRISRTVGQNEVLLATNDQPGTWGGWLPVWDENAPTIGARTLEPSRFLRIPPESVRHMFAHGFPIATHLMSGLTTGLQRFAAATRQQEKLAALGKLSAGLTHELNNPAAAGRRAADRLRATAATLPGLGLALGTSGIDQTTATTVAQLAAETIARLGNRPALGPLERSDREDEIADWLADRAVANDGDLAANFVDLGIDAAWLDTIAATIPPPTLPGLIAYLGATFSVAGLAREIEESTGRIAKLVGAVKSYTRMDRAPEDDVDLRVGLDSTLTMLGHRFRNQGVNVTRDFADDLPRIPAWEGELNQVWTNLLDNALDALDGPGTITIGARFVPDPEPGRDRVVVTIRDDGPGIPAAIQDRIWDPFFTTKAVGQGTGLGLDIVRRIITERHRGEIEITSVPGATTVTVRLPSMSAPPASER